ncbi:hypothetical protein ANN_11519 [Periplaneta americana]|uniref:Uncharacterized protein n=1 Tax=Periplaneta americana TaxID=6978 RepID=A0ABQ8T6N4_PERAM|nr:hypothetical protein ANN_11519 [Periplaneta americana]
MEPVPTQHRSVYEIHSIDNMLTRTILTLAQHLTRCIVSQSKPIFKCNNPSPIHPGKAKPSKNSIRLTAHTVHADVEQLFYPWLSSSYRTDVTGQIEDKGQARSSPWAGDKSSPTP